jgi:B12-binding domain/radical SAM domain protein of rhizo-twelve system
VRYALVNPHWSFEGSTYFGCRDPHLPLELLSASQFLRREGHDVRLIDAHIESLQPADVAAQLGSFKPDFIVIPTAPSYLFWRCPQPELRIPHTWVAQLGHLGRTVLIGPHGSATPGATLRKTNADLVLRGEPDQTLPELASKDWDQVAGCCWREGERLHTSPGLGNVNMQEIQAHDFSTYPLERHTHLHHVFQNLPSSIRGHLGAEVEFARGCPWSCSFCNKTLFRNKYRERDVQQVLREIDAMIARGVGYIYFIDEIFGVGQLVRLLLEEIAKRPVAIGFQSRIDLWDEDSLALLGRAHCVSFECGVESVTKEGREAVRKNCRLSTERITELLLAARQHIPWVQANLIKTTEDDPALVAAWQRSLKSRGVWVSEPVPMFPFPGSPQYAQTFGAPPDDEAWERAHRFYLSLFGDHGYSDIQEQKPLPLEELECAC